jgi:hypothetical protein
MKWKRESYQVRIVKLELSIEQGHCFEGGSKGRVGVQLEPGNVDDEEKKPSSLDVFQKTVSHTHVVARTLD